MIAENEPRRDRRNGAGNGPFLMTDGADVGKFGGFTPSERRLLEEREIRLRALKGALEEGERSGGADYSLSRPIRELDAESPME